jgi:hypothetical protein
VKPLGAIKQKLADRADDKLGEEIEQLKLKRRALARGVGAFAETAHERVDSLVEQARVLFSAEVHQAGAQIPGIENPAASRWAALFLLGSPDFSKTLHATVDAAPAGTFEAGTLKQHEQKLAVFDEEIAERECELERRQAQRRVEEAQAELAAVEKA